MTEDLWDYATAVSAEHAAAEASRTAQERRTMAELLLARGQPKAAALVAMSDYRSEYVDNWNGGVYAVVLSVPAAQFDQVDPETRVALEGAARDITGAEQFSGLRLEVQLVDPEPGWERDLFNRLFREPDGAALALSEGDRDGGS